ncbi:hypothetical protein NJB95_15275 [Brucella intermedia]|uniref:hypothetical protein n=1 Tax=Brucella intermedia TaxID=94625 RepID=UPI0013B004AD|nr:hypothetical protein [Brucella intermedia]MCO7737970.1 hypothetical protein [Brucella intermedia]WLF97575.1 hypothetical protein Q5698_05685 [Brucella intermedia]
MYRILCLMVSGFALAHMSSYYRQDMPVVSYAATKGCICDKNRQPVSACLDVCQWTN